MKKLQKKRLEAEANFKKDFQPNVMTREQIDEYYDSFSWDSMTEFEARRMLNSKILHPEAFRQKSRLLYDWLLLKLTGLPMYHEQQSTQ